MNANRLPPENVPPQGGHLAGSSRPQFEEGSASALSVKWQALHDAAAAIATIATAKPEPMTSEIRHFPAAMRDAGGWRRETAEQGIEDITAILEPGLIALLASLERGADPRVPAGVLWQEFAEARNALLALRPPLD